MTPPVTEIDPTDGCGLPPEEALKLFSLAFKADAELDPDFPDNGSTIPSSKVSGFPVETELTSIGGLLCGERHSISGVTAGETANFPDSGRLSGGVESRHASKTDTGTTDCRFLAGANAIATFDQCNQSGSSAPPTQSPFPAVSDRGLILFAIPEAPEIL